MSPHEVPMRSATEADLGPITALCQAYDVVELGVTDLDVDDIRQMLALAGSSNRVAVGPDSAALRGFSHLDREGNAETAVDPAGPDAAALQRQLLAVVLEEARGLGLPSVTHWSGTRTDGAGRLLAEAKFAHVRSSWRMHVPAKESVGAPSWPAGVGLRPFNPDRDAEAVWAFVQQHFAGAYGSVPRSFPVWCQRYLVAGSDVSCAVEDDQLVGVAVLAEHADHGFIATLVVSSTSRGRGIGLALLRSVICANAHAGRATRLNVDGTNEGALALYRTAGMQVDASFRQWTHTFG